MVAQFGAQIPHPCDDGKNFVDRVIPQLIAGRMGRAPLGHDLHLHPPFVPAVHLHLRGLADDHEIGADALHFDEGVGRQPVAPLLHVPEIVRGDPLQQAQHLGKGQAVHHARSGTLLIARPSRVENAVFHLSLEGVPLPRLGVPDPHRIDVAIVKEHLRPVADAPHDVPHAVEPHVIEAQLLHFVRDALSHLADLAVHAGDGHDIPHEADDILLRGLHRSTHGLNGFLVHSDFLLEL